MYANRITLVGTDQGLGVNLPSEVLASAGDIYISNDGTISLQKLSTKGNAQITSSDNIEINNNLYSEQTLSISADHQVDVKQGIVSAKNVINIDSNQINNQSQVIAGLNVDSSQNSSGVLNITANTKTINTGNLQATQNLNLATNELDNQIGANIIAGNNLTIKRHLDSSDNTKSSLITNAGTLHANDNNTLLATTLNNSGDISATQDLTITANDINSTGEIAADGSFSTQISANNTNITANNLESINTNILGVEDIDLQIANLLTNQGKIQANQRIGLNAKTLDNHNLIFASTATLNATTLNNHSSGVIHAKDNLTITTDNLDNDNQISSDNSLSITTTNDINNHSRISSKQNLNATATNISNNGFFNAAQDLSLTTSNNLTNNKTLFSGNDMKLYVANELNNTEDANIFAFNDLTIAKNTINEKVNKVVNDKANIQTYQGDISIYAKAFENKANPVQIGTNDIGSSTITLYYHKYGTSDALTGWDRVAINSLSYTNQAINTIKSEKIAEGNYYNIYNSEPLVYSIWSPLPNPCANGCTINGVEYDKTEISSSSTINYIGVDDSGWDTIHYTHRYKDRSNQADSLTKYAIYTVADVIEELNEYYSKHGFTIASKYIPAYVDNIDDDFKDYSHPAYDLYYFNNINKHSGETQRRITNTITEDYLISQSDKIAKLSSGKNLNIDVDNFKNYLSEVSAADNIDFTNVLGNVDNSNEVLYRHNQKTGSYYHIYDSGGWWGNEKRKWSDLPTSTTQEVLQEIPSTIQAGSSITGNINTLNNGDIDDGVAVSTTPSQTQTVDTTTNTQTIATEVSDVDAQSVNLPDINLPQDDYGLFIQAKDSQSKYLIETNTEFTLYENFIGSDYLLNRVGFNPDTTLKRIGDGFYEQKLVKKQLFEQTGKRFLQKDITSDNAQYQQLMDNALSAQQQLELIPGVSLTPEQVARLSQDIVWFEKQTVAGQQALVPRLYIADASQYKIKGGKIIAGKDINLNLDNLDNAGLLQAGDNISVSALNQITNQGGTLQADNSINLLATNDIKNTSANIKAKDISLISTKGNIDIKRFEQDADYSRANTKDTKKLIGKQSNILARNKIELTSNKNINIQGSNLKANNVDLTANTLDISTTKQKTDFFTGNSKDYLKENTQTNLKSQITADNINLNANEQANIKGSSIQATNQVNIQSKVLDIAAVKDSSYSQSHTESDGGFFGGSHNETITTQTKTNIQSNINAKKLNINNKATQISASKLKAKTIQITTDLLNLISDKDLDFKQEQSDSSGFLTRTITDKGHNKETKVTASIQARDKLTVNNQELIQLPNSSVSNQLINTQQETLKQLSSADALNTQLVEQLKNQGINLADVKLNNQQWDESTTTLSGLGAVIVQVAAMYFTGGFDALGSVASATTGAATSAATQLTAQQAFTQAAITSVQSQMVSALATSAITGNSLDIDPEQMLKTALAAGASQFAMKELGIQTKYDKTKSFDTNLVGGIQRAEVNSVVNTAINGGSLGDNLKDNLGTEALSVASAKLANEIGANQANLGEIGHKAAHAALGCAGAKASGGDCASGAVGAVAGEMIAEQVGKNQDLDDKDVKALSRIGTGIITQGLGKEVETADAAATNAIENNYLTIKKQTNYAREMNNCQGDANCEQNTRQEYFGEHLANNMQLQMTKSQCLNNPTCTWTQQKEQTYQSLLARDFNKEIIKKPQQTLINDDFGLDNQATLLPERYVSRAEQEIVEDLKAVAEAGFSLTPPGRVYEIGSNVVDLVDDVKTGDFKNTANNVIDRVTHKGLRKSGIPKTTSYQIGAGIRLGRELSNDE